MPSKFVDVTSRNFNSTSAPGLSDEARRAVNAAFDAMSAWRTETVNSSEKSFEQVIDKMAAAARAMGWPSQIIDATRAQMQAITKMQVETLDRMMDAWEEEIKSPSQSTAILSKLKSLPNFGSVGSWPGAAQMAAFNPFGAYMQIAEQWQKAWADAMTFWTKAVKPNGWRAQT
jgi:phage-related minor tail protein